MGFVAPALAQHVLHGSKLPRAPGVHVTHLTEKIICKLLTFPVMMNHGQPETAISFIFCSAVKGTGRAQLEIR